MKFNVWFFDSTAFSAVFADLDESVLDLTDALGRHDHGSKIVRSILDGREFFDILRMTSLSTVEVLEPAAAADPASLEPLERRLQRELVGSGGSGALQFDLIDTLSTREPENEVGVAHRLMWTRHINAYAAVQLASFLTMVERDGRLGDYRFIFLSCDGDLLRATKEELESVRHECHAINPNELSFRELFDWRIVSD